MAATTMAAVTSSLAAMSLAGPPPQGLAWRPPSLGGGGGGLRLQQPKRIGAGVKCRPSCGRRAAAAPRASSAAVATDEPGHADLQAYVKSVLPGGFAAARLWGTGRRKCAVARVVLVDGTGRIIINNRTAQDYLQGNPLWLQAVKYPLASLGYEAKYDTIVRAHGGGLSGQAQAILLGISRALLVANQANRGPLKKQGLLTRDSRVVERKKYGLKKARKAPQFSKR